MKPNSIFSALANRAFTRNKKNEKYFDDRQELNLIRQRIYILPTRAGLLFFPVLAIMLLSSMNYNNSMAFVLTFLLAGMSVSSIFYTYRNLAGLSLGAGKTAAVFAGEEAMFTLRLNSAGRERYSLQLEQKNNKTLPPAILDAPANRSSTTTVSVIAQKRGLLPLGKIRVSSTFPLGLFRAWSEPEAKINCLVYPAPSGYLPLPTIVGQGKIRSNSREGVEGDDFHGYRPYMQGDSPRHVDWKAVAKGRGMLIKQFGGTSFSGLYFRWDDVRHCGSTEAALSQLCHWILQAEEQDMAYGLDLPGKNIPPNEGEYHRHECLKTLALFSQ